MRVLLLSPDAQPPSRATDAAAGLDLYAREEVIVQGSRSTGGKAAIGRALVPTGIAVEIPSGFVGRVGSRSGLSVQHNIEVGAGWVDPDYRGEILVELKNLGSEDFCVEKGARIAQLFILKVAKESIEIVNSLSSSERGEAGFGSTGMK